jgi:subtilisin family serine protease
MLRRQPTATRGDRTRWLSLVRVLLFGLVLGFWPVASLAQPGSAQDWEPGQLLVQPKAGVADQVLATVFASHNARALDHIPQVDTFVLGVPPDQLETVELSLSRSPHFRSVSRNYLRYLQAATPNDYWYPGQWHLPKIQAPDAWSITVGNADVVIAVVDGGAAAVPDLLPKLLPGINIIEGGTDTSDGGGHGTAVSGVAAAATGNSIGVAGVAWLNNILPVKVYTSTGTTTCSAITNGIVWAADHNADIVNMSFGGPSPCSAEKSAVDYAWSKGAVLVAAAGNDAVNTPYYPAAYSNVIAVASTDADDTLSSFSNYGSWLSVAAPGRNLWTTYANGSYSGFSGTSAAAPVVSGIAGLVRSANPALSNSQVKAIIEQTADDLGAPGFDPVYGWGRVNAYKAVLAAVGTPPPPDSTPPSTSITSPSSGATVSGTTTVSVSASDNVGVTAVGLYLDGALLATDTSPPFSFVWDTTAVNDGTHSLQALASDAAGNSATSTVVSVMVNNGVAVTTPPTVAITSPADGSTVSKTVKINVSAVDAVQLQRVEAYVDGKMLSSASCVASTCTASFSWNTSKGVAKGMHTISASAYDTAGHKGSASATVYK